MRVDSEDVGSNGGGLGTMGLLRSEEKGMVRK